MRRRTASGWEVITWAAYARGVGEVVGGLAELGIGPHEHVGILSGNRAEWHLADHGSLANGSVTVPVYQTSSSEQVAYVLGHSEARICFVENEEQYSKVLRVRDELPKLDHIVVFDPPDDFDGRPFACSFAHLCDMGRRRLAREPELYETRARAVQPGDTATLVYTSGTTGLPKGAVITHANIMWTLRNATTPFEIREGERLLSFLPLSHIAERMMSDFLPVAIGGETWFARSLATVAEDMTDCRPTVFFAVPRVWEKLHDAILEKLEELPLVSRQVVGQYIRLGLRQVDREQKGSALGPVGRRLYDVLDRVAGRKLRYQLGLGRAHVLITAAAPIHPGLISWFHAIGLPVLELYGQTEDCGPTTANLPWRNRIGTVGPAIPGVTVRVAEDGELLVRGGNVCAGYFRDPQGTAALIDADGWMHTGDLAELDADGYVRITGRKKDLIINSAGKNIAPQEIEVDLQNEPMISQAVVIGDGRRYLTALLTLDAENLTAWAGAHHRLPDLEALASDPAVTAEIAAAIDRVNQRRSRVEQIKKFRILSHDFTIADGQLTPTLKVKRNVVNDMYADRIEEMYAGD
jgi:long-chain acyl-CoA synthetase